MASADDNGIVRFDDNDAVAPLHPVFNALAQSVSDRFDSETPTLRADTIAERNAFVGTPLPSAASPLFVWRKNAPAGQQLEYTRNGVVWHHVRTSEGGARGLVDTLESIVYVSHRGGRLVYPEHSLEGFRASAESGFPVELDLHALADGTPVCSHDPIVNQAVMKGVSGPVSSLTRKQWLEAQLRPGTPGGAYAVPVLWEQVLNELGGKAVLMPELKASDPNLVARIIRDVESGGFTDSVIVQSADWSVAQQLASHGIRTLFLFGRSTTYTPAQIKGAGIDYVGPSNNVTPATMSALTSAGLRVIPYTINSADRVAELVSQGAWGVFTDDPWTVSDQFARKQADPYAERLRFPGWAEGVDPSDDSPRDVFSYSGSARGVLGATANQVATNTHTLTQGWAPLLSGSVTVRFQAIFYPGSDSQGRWVGAYLGKLPNGVFVDKAVPGQGGYHFLVRRDGRIQIYKVGNNSNASLLEQVHGPEIAPDGKIAYADIEIQLSPTRTVLRCLTTGAGVASTDKTYTKDLGFSLSRSRSHGAAFRDVTIVE